MITAGQDDFEEPRNGHPPTNGSKETTPRHSGRIDPLEAVLHSSYDDILDEDIPERLLVIVRKSETGIGE